MILYSRVIDFSDSEPVSLDEAKDHLEITGTAKDTMITRLITVARTMCEAYAGLSFVTQQRKIVMDYFPCGKIKIPYGPVQYIDSVTYIDSNGDEVELDPANYHLDNNGDLAKLSYLEDGKFSAWPPTADEPNAVEIIYTAGYHDVSGIPLPPVVKQAILMQVATLFENRQDEVVGTTGTVVSMVNINSQTLLDTIKVYWNASY